LLALSSVLVPVTAASAAPGDVTGATLSWGVKSSFVSYINGPIAHGRIETSGVTGTGPFSWAGGSGSSSSVAYPGSMHFLGHQGTGVPADEYALDMTFSGLTVRLTSATAAELVLDVHTRPLGATEYTDYTDVVFATLDLASGTPASTASIVGYQNVPATLTAEGATAFAGFYAAGTALDPVSFSWPVEQAPIVPTLSVSQTEGLDPASATITVTGSDYDTSGLALYGPSAGSPAGVYAQIGWLDSSWRPSQGAGSGARSNAYSVWAQGSSDTAPYLQWTIDENGRADFSWTVTIDKATLDGVARDGATLAVFTVGAGGVVQAANELAVPIAFYDTTTSLTVSQTEGLDPAGATITVTGRNYDTSGLALYGPNAGTPAGVYAQIGWLDSTWRPSQGAGSGARSNAYSVWAQGNSDTAPYLKWTVNDYGLADFNWTVTIDAATLEDVSRPGASLAVFTVGAGGVVQADNELSVPIAFADTTPSLTVSQTSDLDPAGVTITVTGKNYNPDYSYARGVPGFYAQVGWLDANWRPSQGAESGSRSNAYSAWVQGANETAPYVKWSVNAYGLADFTWTVDLTQAALDAKSRSGATLAVFTVGAGGVVQADNELSVPIAFTVPTPGGGNGGENPETPALTAGSLSWGVKASFRSYVTGPIAHGAITTSGVSTMLGNFVFPQAGDAQLANGLGSVAYSGSVRFTGHDGVLDLRLSDPQVRIDSATSGTLLVRVNGGTRVAFANLALASGTKTTDATGAVRYANVPATITAAGAGAFSLEGSTFYPAGTALDPVTFVAGAANGSSAGTVVVASATTRTTASTPAATPPATEGITIIDGELVEGAQVTAEAEGFQSNETGILAVIYSEPTVLAENLTADADGRVSWTGTLPRGLTGTHTLTFQGSVDRGIVLDIDAASELQCTVSDASLMWGFKESFRAYIDGSIANGEWTTEGDVSYATPVFTWSGGTGGADADEALDVQFSGSVRFTGHGGVLDTTIANPRVVVDGDSAVLLLDIHGTTQAGDAVEQLGVEFAELDLAGATRTQDGDELTLADVPAVLTAAGAAAFGTYPEGEALDTLTITATVDGGCATEVETPTATAADDELDTDQTADAGWPVWATVLIIALLAAAIVAAVAIILVRRRRA
jgi:hypothetical protein